MKRDLLLILDPGFESTVGHHYDYNRAVAHAVKERYGYDVIVLSYKNATVDDKFLRVEKVFLSLIHI